MSNNELARNILRNASPILSDDEFFQLHRLLARDPPAPGNRTRIIELAQHCLSLFEATNSRIYLHCAGNFLELLGLAGAGGE